MDHESSITNGPTLVEALSSSRNEIVSLQDTEYVVERSDNLKEPGENDSGDLQEEIKKMTERNRMYMKITGTKENISKPQKDNGIKPLRRTITKFKNISKNNTLKEQLKKGKQIAEEMMNEISTKRKESRKKMEEKRAKRIEGELRVGKMTVIKDISKIRKCDKKMKDRIYKLPNEIINKILKKK